VKTETNILVIGAGPAGLSAALEATTKKKSVVILEREREIGYPIHTSGASYTEDMRKLKNPDRLFNPIQRCIFTSPHETAEFSLPKPLVCILDVRGTYQYLAMQAVKNGCDIKLATTAKRPLIINNFVRGVSAIQQGKEIEIYSKMTIDASGFSACLASCIEPFSGWKRYSSGAEYEAYVENLDKETVHLIVGNQVAPTGYAWVFPLSADRVRIGVGVTRPDSNLSPIGLLHKIIEKRVSVLKDLGEITPIELHVGNLPVEGSSAKSIMNGLILVGDSACQANPLVGEGIRQAMIFGKLAGEVAAKAVENDDTSIESLQTYESRWRDQVQKNYSIALKLQKKLASFDDNAWDKATEKLKILAPDDFIHVLRSDFRKRTILKLVSEHPLLATNTTLKFIMNYL